MTELRFDNYSRVSKPGERPTYEWCVFLDESAEVAETIKSVRYHLHPTFPQPLQVRTSAKQRFALFSKGWGSFEIFIEIEMKSGEMQRTSHQLKLRDGNWPTGPEPSTVTEPLQARLLEMLSEMDYRWRRLGTLVNKAEAPEEAVHAALAALRDLGLARPSPKKASDGQVLWGATKRVGLMPGAQGSR
jgi:hypothetical protein